MWRIKKWANALIQLECEGSSTKTKTSCHSHRYNTSNLCRSAFCNEGSTIYYSQPCIYNGGSKQMTVVGKWGTLKKQDTPTTSGFVEEWDTTPNLQPSFSPSSYLLEGFRQYQTYLRNPTYSWDIGFVGWLWEKVCQVAIVLGEPCDESL